MKKIRLGQTGLMVSELGFGGIPITRLELNEAADLVRHCFDQGVNFFDTAHAYRDSEAKIGAGLAGVRDKVYLATKSMVRDAKGATENLEESLRHLRTETIDLFQFHNLYKPEMLEQILAPGGAYGALDKARDQGKVRHLGFSSHNIDAAIAACRTGLFATVQIPFNFVEHDPADKLFGVARERDMGIIAMKPLGGGMLGRAELCFGFLRQYQDVVPIAGVQSRDEIDEIVEIYRAGRPLSQAGREEIERIKAELGGKFCHRCGYCQPCPEGVNIPLVLLFKSQTKRFPIQFALERNQEVMKTAEGCAQCGECEAKCPYELPIPELIKETVEYYREFERRYAQQ